MTRGRFFFLFSCVLGCLIVHALLAPVAAQAAPPDFSQVVIFATNSAQIGTDTDVLSGDIVVNNVASSPTLVPGAELSIESGAATPGPGVIVAAHRLQVKLNAVVGGNVRYNTLTNNGVILGSHTTPVTPPFFLAVDIPPFQTGVPGLTDVVVGIGQTVMLPPGDYRNLSVGRGGMLVFAGGVYNVQSINVGQAGQLLFVAQSAVRVVERVFTARDAKIGPQSGSGISAAHIVLYVNGMNGGSLPKAMPAAVVIGEHNQLQANVYAPNGTVYLLQQTQSTGALLAKDVRIERDNQLTLNSAFVEGAPSVASTLPVNGATAIAPATNLTITFSEAVTVAGNWFQIVCATSGTRNVSDTVVTGGPTVFTINPNTDFAAGETCTVTVFAAQVTDWDTQDPPNTLGANFAFMFTAEGAPAVTGTTPTAGATEVARNTNLTITFNEPVNVTASAFTIACPTGTPIAFTNLTGTGPASSFTLDPTADLPAGTVCTVKVIAAQVTDQDTTDPPDTMAADFTFSFITLCPTLTISPTTLTNGTAGTAYGPVAFMASGGTGTISWSLSAGALPTGMNFSAGGSLSGTPTPVGTFGFTVKATDVNGCMGTQPLSLTIVCPVITVTSPGVNTGQVGQAFSQSFGQSGAVGSATFSLNSGTLPTGVTLSAAGVLSGTPTQTGSFPLTVKVTDANGCMGTSATYTLMIRPDAVNDTYPQTVIGNVSINSALIPFSVLTNDLPASPVTITAFDATSAQGGNVTVNANGTFTYNPPAGFEGTDTFNYTITSNGQTDTATVSLPVSGMIWFIDNSLVSNGNGRLSGPFNSIANFNAGAADEASDNIFLYRQTGTNYTGPLTLLNNQRLIGQGATASLASILGITVPSGSAALPATSGTRPVLAHNATNLTLGQGNLLRGFNLSNTGGTALTGSSFGNLTTSEVSVSNSSGIAINLSTGNPTASFTSVSASGGTNGIVLSNTTGSFTVTGVGTTDGTGGTIQNTTTRGASFTNATNITLQNMNFTNAATTQSGTNCANLSLGGNSNLGCNAPIHLDTVTNATLTNLNISGSVQQGINGRSVTNFVLSDTVMTGIGDAADEDGIHFLNMLGTSSITNTSVSGSFDDNLIVQNLTGTTNLTISGSSFTNSTQGSGMLFGIRGGVAAGTGANTTINITGGTSSTNNFSGGIVADTFDGSTMSLTVSGSTSSGNNDQLSVSAGDNSNVDLNANGNTLSSPLAGDFVVVSLLGSAFDTGYVFDARIQNNTITVGNDRTADGIIANNAGGGALRAVISGNTINYRGTQSAITIQGGQDGSGAMNFTVTGNNIDMQIDGTLDATVGILANVAVTGPGNTTSLCADIGGSTAALRNTFTHSLGGNRPAGDVRVRQRNDGTVRLPGYGGAATDTAAVVTYLAGRNTLVNSPTATATAFSTGFAGGAACTQPSP